MPQHVIGSLQNALKWVANKAGGSCEGVKAPGPTDGRPLDSQWRPLRADLSDLPRGEKWLLRPVGASKAMTAVFLPPDPPLAVGAIVQHDPLTHEEMLRRQAALLAERENFLEWAGAQQESLARRLAIVQRVSVESDDQIRKVATERLGHIEDMRLAKERESALRDELSGERERSEVVRQVGAVGTRLSDMLILWRVKRASDLPPDLVQKVTEYLERTRSEQARPEMSERRKAAWPSLLSLLHKLDDATLDELVQDVRAVVNGQSAKS